METTQWEILYNNIVIFRCCHQKHKQQWVWIALCSWNSSHSDIVKCSNNIIWSSWRVFGFCLVSRNPAFIQACQKPSSSCKQNQPQPWVWKALNHWCSSHFKHSSLIGRLIMVDGAKWSFRYRIEKALTWESFKNPHSLWKIKFLDNLPLVYWSSVSDWPIIHVRTRFIQLWRPVHKTKNVSRVHSRVRKHFWKSKQEWSLGSSWKATAPQSSTKRLSIMECSIELNAQ